MTPTPPAGLTMRVLTPEDLDALYDLGDLVFNLGPSPAAERELQGSLQKLELGRGIGFFDGDELAAAGTLGGFTMSVPGGTAPMAAVLVIAVSPVYRRRGLMTAMIRHQLSTLHDEGLEPLAGLTASEATIYGRFGYGVASYFTSFTVPRAQRGLRPVEGAGDILVRLVPTAGSVEVCEAIYARQFGRRPGMLVRSAAYARLFSQDLEEMRQGRSALRTVIASRAGVPVGYARYRTKDEEALGVYTGYTDVRELYADDPASFAALARWLMDIDLTGGVNIRRQPPDSPLVYLLSDFRAAQFRMGDGLYLRLVDVDRALALRTYSAPVDLVLEITDGVCPWNAGRWRLSGDEKSATCERAATGAAADLALDVRELASAYLGGATLAALSVAGLVRELRPGALTEASRAFATDLAPWLPFGI